MVDNVASDQESDAEAGSASPVTPTSAVSIGSRVSGAVSTQPGTTTSTAAAAFNATTAAAQKLPASHLVSPSTPASVSVTNIAGAPTPWPQHGSDLTDEQL